MTFPEAIISLMFLALGVAWFYCIKLRKQMDKMQGTLQSAFGVGTVDAYLWSELERLDNGQRINVPMTVFDLRRIRDIADIAYNKETK